MVEANINPEEAKLADKVGPGAGKGISGAGKIGPGVGEVISGVGKIGPWAGKVRPGVGNVILEPGRGRQDRFGWLFSHGRLFLVFLFVM